MGHKTQIMYIEHKTDGIVGKAKIGRITFSKTGRTIYYNGKTFQSLNGRGFKANYFDTETKEQFWISNCHKDGRDALYSTTAEIDEDVREDYWTEIRNMPEMKNTSFIKVLSKY